ncbi:MAG: hypothetical protein J7456_12070, partial [Chloroflexus sp.]|nr:hypothetical protein [Chloroflexus sp.]
MIPVTLPDSSEVHITAGGQNALIKQIMEEFYTSCIPCGTSIYIGDAGNKFGLYNKDYAACLGIIVNEHGKMPDVIVHLETK